eukprot:SAG31_NODE_2271_length_6040_cov_3.379397_2_plen_556_part_00
MPLAKKARARSKASTKASPKHTDTRARSSGDTAPTMMRTESAEQLDISKPACALLATMIAIIFILAGLLGMMATRVNSNMAANSQRGDGNVEVRPSEIAGGGLGSFARRTFVAGQLVGPYRCRVDHGQKTLVGYRSSHQYTWVVNKTHTCNAEEILLRNPMRYVNSIASADLCSKQNIEMRHLPADSESPIGYFATRNIQIGEELLVDYGEAFFNEKPALDVRYECKQPPLHLACMRAEVTAVKRLLSAESKNDVNQRANTSLAWTPLMAAALGGSIDVIRLLLQHGADIDGLQDQEGQPDTPLFVACQHGHFEAAKILLEHGAEVNARNKHGHSPLCTSSQEGNVDIVALLLSSGAQVDQTTIGNEATALHIAAQYGHESIVTILLDHGAALNRQTVHGETALYSASMDGRALVASIWLKRGAIVGLESLRGVTPLFIASQQGHSDVVALLLADGALVDHRAKHGFTPLLVACEQGHVEVVNKLVEAGVDVDMSVPNGPTPLMLASFAGRTTIVELLLRANANASISIDGDDALSLAVEAGNRDIAAIIQRRIG